MKRWLILLLAAVCLCTAATAEEPMGYDIMVLGRLFATVEDMAVSEEARETACAAATMDYMAAALTTLSLGADSPLPASDYIMLVSAEKQAVLFLCTAAGGGTVQTMVITCVLGSGYTLQFSAVPMDALAEGMQAFGQRYDVSGPDAAAVLSEMVALLAGE